MSRLAALLTLLLLAVACGADGDGADGDGLAGGDRTHPPATATAPPGRATATPTAGATGGVPGATAPEPTGAPTGPTSPELSAQAWARLADAPEALTEVAAAALSGAVWVAGGFDASGQAVDTVQVYDPTFGLWEAGPSLPEPVHHAALVSTGDALLLVGGYTGSDFSSPTDAVRRLDPATGAWEDGPALPSPRAAGAAAWDGSRVVYAGGVGPEGVAGDVFALAGEQWERAGALSEAREHLAAAGDGQGRVWFLAGRTGGLDRNLATVDLVEGARVTAVGAVPTARGGVTGFHHPSAGGCVAGGEQPDGTFAEVECVDADGSVSQLPGLTVARHGLGAAVVDGIAYVVLGGGEPGLAVSPAIEALRLE